MINLADVHFPSEHIRERSRLMWAVKWDQGQFTLSYKVTPHGSRFQHKTKDCRLVLFDLKRRIAECLSLETGEVCKANSFGRLCSHVYAASKRLKKKTRRSEQKAA